MSEDKPVILAELTDDEILNIDPSTLPEEDEEKNTKPAADAGDDPDDGDNAKKDDDTDDDPDKNKSAEDGDDKKDDDAGNTGGTDPVDDPSDDDDDADPASDKEAGKDGNDDPGSGEPGDDPKGDQPSGDDPGKKEKGKTSDKPDYEAELAKIMAPFKADKREIKVKTPEEVRRLMQMGVNYSRKMEAMKPYQKVLKTLEKNGLLDIGEINFMIDLVKKKNPDAIRKFLKDSDIDPMDLNLKDDVDYKPTDHAVGDDELALDAVIDDIRDTESFDKTVDVITNQWDTASRRTLLDNPGVIRNINDHVEAGIYDMIADRMATERILGKHVGLSDLEAYGAVGDAMHEEGKFDLPAPGVSKPTSKADQASQNPNGSDDDSDKETDRKNRRKAASPPRGKAASGKKKLPNFAAMSDKEIEEFDISTL